MFKTVIKLCNENSGFIGVIIFVTTLILGWASGIFSALRKRPKFKIQVLPGPTLCTTYPTGNKYQNFDTHQTAISVYLNITNLGNAPSSIDTVTLGYHRSVSSFSLNWIKYRIGWFSLEHPITAMEEFQYEFKNRIKYYPFLLQGENADTYLKVGKSKNGIIYFEQNESWGESFPVSHNNQTKIRIVVHDSYGNKYKIMSNIPIVSLEDAQKFNPSFGMTFSSLTKETKKETRPNKSSEPT